jgi:hypothetical protein
MGPGRNRRRHLEGLTQHTGVLILRTGAASAGQLRPHAHPVSQTLGADRPAGELVRNSFQDNGRLADDHAQSVKLEELLG